jgi:hypothetical protein
MAIIENPSIVAATKKDIDRLARLIRHSFADVARRFALTPQNCPKHPSNYTPVNGSKVILSGVCVIFF